MDNEAHPELLEVPPEVLAILRCPACAGTLSQQPAGLSCSSCGRFFPLVNRVVRFVEAQEYAGTFGFQWHKYARTQLDNEDSHESETDFRQNGFSPEELSGKWVLDVGCGMGRFAEVASRCWGARVVGVDLSVAAEVAARNLAHRDSVTIFQADLFSLPVRGRKRAGALEGRQGNQIGEVSGLRHSAVESWGDSGKTILASFDRPVRGLLTSLRRKGEARTVRSGPRGYA